MKRILATAILAICTTLVYANTDPAKADPSKSVLSKFEVAARGQQIAGAVCLACHGLDGMSVISANPNIAGMPAQYIAKQLELFKSGARKNATMKGMAANLSDEDMKALGLYYFAQRSKPNATSTSRE